MKIIYYRLIRLLLKLEKKKFWAAQIKVFIDKKIFLCDYKGVTGTVAVFTRHI